MILRGYILGKRHYVEDDAASRGAGRELRRRQRVYKEELFKPRTLLVRVGDDVLQMTVDEFINSEGVQAFSEQLSEKFSLSSEKALEWARCSSRPAMRIPIEFLFTGGGNTLSMVRALAAHPPYDWDYNVCEPDFDGWLALSGNASGRRLVVAAGGAMLELPEVAVPE